MTDAVRAHIIATAKHIRRQLVRTATWRHKDLRNACGLASALLAEAAGDLGSLRLGRPLFSRGWHAWNVFGETIIDITATQFNTRPATALNVRGVLVLPAGAVTRYYHENVYHSGIAAARHINGYGWYADDAETLVEWKRRWSGFRARILEPDRQRLIAGY